jgi:PBP1b-binding outer membrane lipoprotein LpoB
MKTAITVLAISTLTLTSCSSGWSCKASYVKTNKKTEVERVQNA